MNATRPSEHCVLMLLADGFNEVEAIGILSALRDAGIYVKSIGLTGGLITGRHGIPLMPDHALINLTDHLDISTLRMIILPGTKRSFANLAPDPRVHRLLRQVVAQRGLIATNAQGYRVLQSAFGDAPRAQSEGDARILLRTPHDPSVEAFAQTLVRRLKHV